MKRQTVLITGASKGIGREFAKIFASHCFDLVLVARSENQLIELAEQLEAEYFSKVDVFVCDLSESGSAEKLYADLVANGIHIDQLVNNAGAGLQSSLVEADPNTLKQLINLNISSVTMLCRLLGADMVKSGSGRILNVASLGAFIPDPYFNVYGPSKAFELFLTQAMYGELKGSGVSVSVLCPGPTKTGWALNAGKADSRFAKDPAKVAQIGYEGMQQGRLIIIPTMLFKLERFGMALLPTKARIDIIRNWQKMLIEKNERPPKVTIWNK